MENCLWGRKETNLRGKKGNYFMKWRFVTDLLDWSCFASELQRNWSFCIWQPAARLCGATVNPGVVQRNTSLFIRERRLKGSFHPSMTNSVIKYSTSCQRRLRRSFHKTFLELFVYNWSSWGLIQRPPSPQTPLDPKSVPFLRTNLHFNRWA